MFSAGNCTQKVIVSEVSGLGQVYIGLIAETDCRTFAHRLLDKQAPLKIRLDLMYCNKGAAGLVGINFCLHTPWWPWRWPTCIRSCLWTSCTSNFLKNKLPEKPRRIQLVVASDDMPERKAIPNNRQPTCLSSVGDDQFYGILYF